METEFEIYLPENLQTNEAQDFIRVNGWDFDPFLSHPLVMTRRFSSDNPKDPYLVRIRFAPGVVVTQAERDEIARFNLEPDRFWERGGIIWKYALPQLNIYHAIPRGYDQGAAQIALEPTGMMA